MPPEHVAAAALHWIAAQRATTPELGCWSQAQGFTGWRLANGASAAAPLPNLVLKSGTAEWPVRFGAPQADGSMKAEDRMDVRHVADSVLHMANLPLAANVLFMNVMATKMPFVGRG